MAELFDSTVYARRLEEAARLCQVRGLAGLIIGTGPELAYLTGSWLSSHERFTAVVVPAVGRPVLLVPVTDVGDVAHSAVPELDVQVRGWTDGQDPHALAVAALGETGAVALGSSLTTLHVLDLQRKLVGRETVAAEPQEMMPAMPEVRSEHPGGSTHACGRAGDNRCLRLVSLAADEGVRHRHRRGCDSGQGRD